MVKSIYNPVALEEKWQTAWEKAGLFQQIERQPAKSGQEKMYLLFAFAYPSGSGLHVGHVESKTALDIMARYYRMNGKQVFFPVGWDAFGLPAENYAIKTGVSPATTTKEAINTFRRQIKRLGISYDWANELATNHPEYYHWTQWIFLQLYSQGLAYRGVGLVNWCPKDQTVLANEQVINGECERCGTKVIQKELEQWYFKITKYQDELISGLEKVDWPRATKEQQLHWIGRKQGINITYKIEGTDQEIVCFSTRPDTNFGATFIVIAPEHPLAQALATGEMKSPSDASEVPTQLQDYLEETKSKSELDRQTEGRKKTGVFTGLYALNTLNDTKLPIWVSDFVLGGFGTGAVVGVPGHDKRDFQFAQAMDLPVKRVVIDVDGNTSDITEENQIEEDDGVMINSGFLDGMETAQAIPAMMDYMEERGIGQRVTTYKLRDWLISRQRYWGAPIPIVYDPQGKPHPVKDEHLPWTLPTDVDFKPTGESPLKSSKEFHERTERLYGKGWRPEYDTMDTFVDSSWYYLRYVDSRDKAAFASQEQLDRWLPVDFYMIGPEHIVLHLLYSRFFTKFLRDQGYLKFDEPFMKMRHQGMILGPDGKKMSKSKGNVINPDEVIEKFGADTLRAYEMFMGPIEADKPWDVRAVAGVYRFLTRVYDLVGEWQPGGVEDAALHQKFQSTIKKVSDDIPKLKFNTAIAAFMELMNAWEAGGNPTQEDVKALVKILAPFAPFLAEELWHILEPEAESVHLLEWPTWDESVIEAGEIQIPVQVNGKLRAQLTIGRAEAQDEQTVLAQAKALEKITPWLDGHPIVKEIYVPGKIVNLVVR